MTAPWRGFASDNYAGIHPDVLAAMGRVNVAHQPAYGDDEETGRLSSLIREEFGPEATVYPVFNGTGANVVALSAICQRWEAVICADTAHINCDEGGAPEKVAGLKLHLIATPDGKLTPELVDLQAWGFGDVHRAQPRAVSITQSTELGTVYTPDEVRSLADHAHDHGLALHMDGARIANAAAALGVSLRSLTTDVGVDVLSFGGTKNGAMMGEAVVVLNPKYAGSVPFLRKSTMQLSSKMRFVSAQLSALLTDQLWRRNAEHANAMARRLEHAVKGIPGVTLTRPVQANAVFPVLPASVTDRLQQRFRFYTWNQHTGEVRWMCSWDTTEADVDAFAAAVREEMAAHP